MKPGGLAERLDLSASTILISVATLLLVVASVAQTASAGLVQPRIAMAFGIFIAVGELVRINLPGDRVAAPLGAAGALGYALLADYDGGSTRYSILQVVAVVSIAILVGTIPYIATARAPKLSDVSRRILVTAVAAALFRPVYGSGSLHTVGKSWLLPALMVSVVVLADLFDAALAASERAGRDHVPFLAALRDESRAIIGIGAAIGATGVLIALASDVMGAWALPVFAIPLLVTQFSFRRYAAIRATYLQTIRALSRVTEVGGYTESGHARRVSQLSLAVGRELGLTEVALQDLEYAALMHDIGQLSLADPIPGGATVVAAPDEQRRIAEMGAQIVRQTGVLDHVALIVERQAEPYRRPGEQVDPSVPIQSRIIRAVNAYDDLVGGSLETERRLQGLERLRLGMAYDYDPRIVETLTRVVERTTLLSV